MIFIVEKKSYVSKISGEKKFAYNLFISLNGIKLPLSLKGDTTALLIAHQLLDANDLLCSLNEDSSISFEAVNYEK